MQSSVKSVQAIRPVAIQVRTMATEKQILMRITSTRNISKITKSMKMVSAAKLRGAETRLTKGRPYANFLNGVYGQATVFADVGPQKEIASSTNLIVPVTSDRGLCGGVNTYIAKATKATVEELKAAGKGADLFVLGEKGRAQLRRGYSNETVGNVVDLWKNPTFAQASAIAEAVLASGEHEQIHVIYNVFESALSQIPHTRRLVDPSAPAPAEGVESLSDRFLAYEVEPEGKEEVLQDFHEFSLASAIYGAMLESATSEESSRMSAMENATKNAQELVDSLTLVYNKARQARITTELIEIISGAASLEG